MAGHTRNDNRVALERALWPPGRSARDPGEHFSLPYLLPLWQSAPGVTWAEEGAVTQVAFVRAIAVGAIALVSILDEEILDGGTRPLCCPGGAEKSGSLEQH